jgi:hypothetical protein
MGLKEKFEKNSSAYNPTVRTNAENIPGGTYTNSVSGNLHGYNLINKGAVLRDLDDKIIINTLNQWSEKDKYLNSMTPPKLFLDLEKARKATTPQPNNISPEALNLSGKVPIPNLPSNIPGV